MNRLTGFDPCIEPTTINWKPSVGEKVLFNSDQKEYIIVTVYATGAMNNQTFKYKIRDLNSNAEIDQVEIENLKFVCKELEKYISQRFLKNPNEDSLNSNEVVKIVLQLDDLMRQSETEASAESTNAKKFAKTQNLFKNYAKLLDESVREERDTKIGRVVAVVYEGTLSTTFHPSVRHPKLSTKEINAYVKYWKYKKFIEIFDNRNNDADYDTKMKELSIPKSGPDNYVTALAQMKTLSAP